MVVLTSLLVLPDLSRPGQAPPLPFPVSAGLRGSAGLPASAVCHGGWRAEADRPGRRQRRGDALSELGRLQPPVPKQKLHSALLRSGSV